VTSHRDSCSDWDLYHWAGQAQKGYLGIIAQVPDRDSRQAKSSRNHQGATIGT